MFFYAVDGWDCGRPPFFAEKRRAAETGRNDDIETTPVYAETEEVEVEEPRERTKADVLREQIVRALRHNNGRRREAAAELFMSERTLYRKIKELGIEE